MSNGPYFAIKFFMRYIPACWDVMTWIVKLIDFTQILSSNKFDFKQIQSYNSILQFENAKRIPAVAVNEYLQIIWVFMQMLVKCILKFKQFKVWMNISASLLSWEQGGFHSYFTCKVGKRMLAS